VPPEKACVVTRILLKSVLATMAAWLIADPAWAQCRIERMLLLPITMAGSQPLITVQLNGMEAHMLMDTGSFFSFVTPEAAKRTGLNVGAAPRNLTVEGIGGQTQVDMANVREFTVAGQTVRHVDLLVYGDRLSAGGVDGILGQNFLHLYDIEIDLANGVARLIRTSDCDHANLAYWTTPGQANVLEILSTDRHFPQIVANAQVNGVDVRVMFDTGAATSHLSLGAAARAGITPQSPGVSAGGLRYGFGSAMRDTWIAPFRSFKLDSEETLNTHLRIGDIGSVPRDVEMLLGADFFLSHHVFIAYGQRKVFFTYNGGPVFDLSARGIAVAHAPALSSAPAGSAPTGASPSAAELDRRAEAWAARGELTPAIADFGLAVAADPGNALYRLHRAATLQRSGNVRDAIADLDEALRLQPDFTDALMLRASIRIRNDDLNGARADYAAAESNAPGRFELPLTEANDYTTTGRYRLALAVLNRWIDAHPRDQRRYDALGERCLVRGLLNTELDAALSDCNAARRNSSSNSQILYDRGIVQLRRKQFDKALADFNDSLELQPRFAAALYARGVTRIAKGDQTAGDADLKDALAIGPRIATLFHDVDLGP